MGRTKVDISFGLVDVEAKNDTTAMAEDKQPFINPNDLRLEGVYAPKVATMEGDYWRLDGTFQAFPNYPNDVTWGLWSLQMTDETGQFSTPVMLTLTFTALHESIGLTFEFNPYDNSYPRQMNVKWYQGSILLAERTAVPDNWRHACMEQVEGYNKIVITFQGMNKPYRYLKVQNIMHGVIREFGEEELQEVNLLEEIDLTGTTLSVNTLDFTLHSKDDDFNIFNPKGVYNLLQKKQQLIVTGEKNGELLNLGTFYVEEMESQSNRILSISATDGIGILGGTTFLGGMYKNALAADVVEEIMDDGGFGYTLDSALRSRRITGHLPIFSHREALQAVAFAIGGYVTTARSGTVNIRALPALENTPIVSIGLERKHLGSKVKLRKLVTGVDATEHSFILGTEAEEISKSDVVSGENLILFSEPATRLTASLGTITKQGVNYCIVTCEIAGECVISGKKYTDNQKIVKARLDNIPAGEKESILQVDCGLLHSGNSKEVAERLLAVSQYRIEQGLTFVMDKEAVGALADVETEYGIYRGAIIESLDTDLTGGFITKAVVVGE